MQSKGAHFEKIRRRATRGEIVLHFSRRASRGTTWPLHFKFASYAYAFDVQEVTVSIGPGSITVVCNFAEGSDARGCHIVISEQNSGEEVQRNATRQLMSGSVLTLTTTHTENSLQPGVYDVSVFDLESDGGIDSQSIIHSQRVDITPPTPTPTPVPSLPPGISIYIYIYIYTGSGVTIHSIAGGRSNLEWCMCNTTAYNSVHGQVSYTPRCNLKDPRNII